MNVTDFADARIAWTTHDGSRGLWRVTSIARHENDGQAWFLAAGVMAGDVYGSGPLPMDPAYSFQFVASHERHVMFREPVGTAALLDTDAPHVASFSDVAIEVGEIEGEIVDLRSAAAMSRWPLTARLTATGASGARWLLDFPVNHINLREKPEGFQVETGPIVVPADLIDIAGAARPAGVQLAFIFFNQLDRVDLLAFGPGASGRGYRHFSRLDGVMIGVCAA